MTFRRQLRSITGLKVLATLGIFIWYCGLLKSPDLGARCVKIFLVVSGFLTAYNHHGSYEGTLDEGVAIVRKKLRSIYPVYLAGFLLAVVVILANDVLPRSVYTALPAGLVLLLALEAGPVARLLGAAPLLAAGRFELDFYVFHQPCIKLVGYLIGGPGRKALAAFVLACVLVWLWRAARGAWVRAQRSR